MGYFLKNLFIKVPLNAKTDMRNLPTLLLFKNRELWNEKILCA